MKKVLILLLMGCLSLSAFTQEMTQEPGLYAEFQTPKGNMLYELDVEETPLAVISFIGLAEGTILPNDDGTPYYSGLTFYHRIDEYALFSGDPKNDGTGETDITFPQQMNSSISLAEKGVLALQGYPGISHGGKFFITLKGDGYLDKVYTPFGKIVAGMDLLDTLDENTPVSSIKIIRVGDKADDFEATQEALEQYIASAREAQLEKLESSNPELSENLKALSDFNQTESGMYYHILYEGYGDKPQIGQTVTVHYSGSLLDGTLFDSSLERGTPFTMTLGKDPVIQGWVETLMDMQPGEGRIVFIPPNLGYGSQGAGNSIPPNAWLRFEIQLLSVE